VSPSQGDIRRSRAFLLVAGALIASVVLVGAYLAAGGSSYTPKKVQNPCEPRPWSNPQSLGQIANQFTISALDGAACKLGVSREALARALATPEGRERFKQKYRITDKKLAEAVRAGLVRAIDDAEEAGALSPLIAGPLRETVQHIPLKQAIEFINDAESFLGNAEGFLGPAQNLLEQFLP
jgi:hypothetical protein